MHRILKWIPVMMLATSLALCSVAAAEDSYYLELPTSGISASMNISVNVPGENPVQDGINPLTGETWYGMYHPILVNIDTHPRAASALGRPRRISSMRCPSRRTVPPVLPRCSWERFPPMQGCAFRARADGLPCVRSGAARGSSMAGRSGPLPPTPPWMWLTGRSRCTAMPARADAGSFPFVEGGLTRNYTDLFHRESSEGHVAPYNVQVDMKGVEALFTSEPTKHPFKFTDTGLDRGVDVTSIELNSRLPIRLTSSPTSTTR